MSQTTDLRQRPPNNVLYYIRMIFEQTKENTNTFDTLYHLHSIKVLFVYKIYNNSCSTTVVVIYLSFFTLLVCLTEVRFQCIRNHLFRCLLFGNVLADSWNDR